MDSIRFDEVGPCGVTREHLARLQLTGLQMLIVALGTARGGTFTETQILADVDGWQRQHGPLTRDAVVDFIRSDFAIGFGLRVAVRRADAHRARSGIARRRKRPPGRHGVPGNS